MITTVAVKPISMLASRTFWINLVVAVLAFISEIQALLPEFADILVLPQDWSRWLLLITAIGNIILRRFSDTPARFAEEPVQVERFEG